MKSLLKPFAACAAMCGFAAVAFADGIIDITARVRDANAATLTLIEGKKYNNNSLVNLFTTDATPNGRALFVPKRNVIQYDIADSFEAGKPICLTSFKVIRPNNGSFEQDKRMPTVFKLEGSLDGETWVELLSATFEGWSSVIEHEFEIPVDRQSSYRHYRFTGDETKCTDSNCAFNIQQLIFYGAMSYLGRFTITPITESQWWNGEDPVEPALSVTDFQTGDALTEGIDYEVTYSNNTTAPGYGTATVISKRAGIDEGCERTISFPIVAMKGAWRKIYNEVEYLQVSGNGQQTATTWVNTGFRPAFTNGRGTRVEATFEPSSLSANFTVFCSRRTYTTASYDAFFLVNIQNPGAGKANTYRFAYADAHDYNTSLKAVKDEKVTLVVDGNRFMKEDGTLLAEGEEATFDGGGSIVLMASYSSATADKEPSGSFGNGFNGKYYSFVIKDAAGNVLRNLVPARTKGENPVGGFVDTVEHDDPSIPLFYPNGGTGVFAIGPDVQTGGDSLTIGAVPLALGVPDPAYGRIDGVMDGREIVCAMPVDTAADAQTMYRCTGWKLYYADELGEWGEAVSNGMGTTFTYRHERGRTAKLEWQWGFAAHRTKITADAGRELFTFSPESPLADPGDPNSGFFAPGTVVTVTPHGATEPTVSTFLRWDEPLPEGATVSGEALTFTVPDAPLTVNATFSRHWTFQERAEDEDYPTVTDGNWTLFVTPYSGTTIDGVSAPYRTIIPQKADTCIKAGSGRLDFTTLNDDLMAAGVTRPFKHLANNTFAGSAVTEVIIPSNIPSAFGCPFNECRKLVSVTLYPTFELWTADSGTGMFRNCTALKTVSMPNAKVVPPRVFCFCSSLTEVLLPDTVTNIMEAAFYSCTSLTSVKIPASVVEFGETCFSGTALPAVELSPRLEKIGNGVFFCDNVTPKRSILSASGDLVFPKTLTAVGEKAFRWTGITNSLDFSATKLTRIETQTFSGVPFRSVTLPASVTNVGPYAFNLPETQYKLPLGEVRFLGLPPVLERSADRPDVVAWNEDREWDLIVRPRRDDPATLAAWRALPNFVDKEDFDGLESKKNYETVSKMKGFIGVLDNSWVVTWVPPSAGMKVLIR